MASIGTVLLSITGQNPANVQVSFLVSATGSDGELRQSYRELVELIGIDRGAGEDGVDDVIDVISDSIVTFSTSQVAFQQIREKNLPAAVLDEDPGPIIRRDELRARVTLIPAPARPRVRHSNVVLRGAPVVG